MSFTKNIYRFECDTDTIVGKFEDIFLQYMNWRILQHTSDGNFIALHNNLGNVFNNETFIGIKWEYANDKHNKIIYRFYILTNNKINYIDNIAKDIIYIQKNGDLKCYGYRFGQLAFTYKGIKL